MQYTLWLKTTEVYCRSTSMVMHGNQQVNRSKHLLLRKDVWAGPTCQTNWNTWCSV